MKRSDSKYGTVLFSRCIQRSLLLVFSLLVSTYASTQTSFKTDSTGFDADTLTNDTIHSFSTEMPKYPGGDAALNAFFRKTIQWPEIDDDSEIHSTFYLSWVVEKDGSVTNPKVKSPSRRLLPKELEQSILHAISKLSDFKPTKMNGTPVRFRLQVPLHIRLQD